MKHKNLHKYLNHELGQETSQDDQQEAMRVTLMVRVQQLQDVIDAFRMDILTATKGELTSGHKVSLMKTHTDLDRIVKTLKRKI